MWGIQNPVSFGTHFFAFFCAVFASLMLRRVTVGAQRRASVTVFGLSMIFLYAASSLYHAYRTRVLQEIDQSAVYCFIAGTYTPIMVMLLRGKFRQFLLIGIWLLAALGIICLWHFSKLPHAATVSIYLGMGWIGCMGGLHYFRAVGVRGMSWALGGAAWYTFGAVLELTNWPVLLPGVVQSHEIFHLCIMAATTCHYIFILKYVVPYVPAVEVKSDERSEPIALGYA